MPGGNKRPSTNIPSISRNYFILVIKEIAKIELALDTEINPSNPKTLLDYENEFLAKLKAQDEFNKV